jgi:hypothetical protein
MISASMTNLTSLQRGIPVTGLSFGCPEEYLRELERIHPERRPSLRPTDDYFDVISEYLILNRERRPNFLDQAIRQGRVRPIRGSSRDQDGWS